MPSKSKKDSKKRPREEEEEEEVEDEVVEEEEEEEEEEEGDSDDNDSDNNSDNDDGDDDDDDSKGDDDDNDDDSSPKKKSKKSSKKSAKKTDKKGKKATVTAKSKQKKTVTVTKLSGKKASSSSSSASVEVSVSIKPKKVTKMARLEEARKAYKWWEADELPDGINWKHLEHTGIVFAPSYKRHYIPMKYDNEIVKLTAIQEELASFYAAIPPDGPQLGNEKTRKVFQQNFFADFVKEFPQGTHIKKFDKCDFTDIKRHLDTAKTLKKAATKEEKLAVKNEKEVIALYHSFSLIDGRIEKMGNYNMEPPGLFRGRGDHPKTGQVKKRCFGESVHINISDDAPVPMMSMPGHSWASVRHDPAVTWLCSWNENINDATKYVMLAASSSFKGKSDQEKYSKAIRLKHCINTVRKDYMTNIKSKDRAEKQLGTAMWIIDRLALRVGGEKGDEEADTVGCCSLRREHLKFNPDASTYEIELEFLGKDSMLYKQNINFARYDDIGKSVYSCLVSFCADKKEDEDVFETLNPSILNKHLSELMKGLSAKVFRTFNASVTLEKELPSAESLKGLSIQDKVLRYNAANREVAILCNHQKTVSKATETMFENLNEKLSVMQEQRDQLIKWKALCKGNKADKIPLKADDSKLVDKLKSSLDRANDKLSKATSESDKISAMELCDKAKAAINEDKKRKLKEKHLFASTPTVDKVEVRIEKWVDDIRKLEVDIRNRDENKEVALGTSKINYMDPRISVAWCKRCDVPIDKVFPTTLRDKFNWAMTVPPDWKFE